MSTGTRVLSARVAWLLLACVVAVVALLVIHPHLRSAATGCAGILAVAMIALGIWRHRPRSASWPLLALMLAFWTVSAVLVHVQGQISPAAVAAVWAGQAVASVVTVHAVMSGKKQAGRSLSAGLDLLVIAIVTFLVGAQIVVAGTSQSRNWTAVVVACIDVALLSMLVRFAVSRRALGPSNVLVLGAAFLAISYDLISAVQGRRVALPGEPAQVLAVAFMLLFGVAALHPSMVRAFSAETFTQRRQPSIALLGLLPLLLLPLGVAWAAELSGAQSLPAWVVPAAGASVAAVCLLRASSALRTSEHLAEHDPLTALANRRGLERAFNEARAGSAVSLLLVDIDEFKQVNDTHGHDVGDAFLLRLRDRLVAATGSHGLVARLGGDEFVVLTQTSLALGIAERFLLSLKDPVVLGTLVLPTGASVGLADAEGDHPLAELLTHADVAMYAAKGAGGGRVRVFHPAMRVEVARRYTLSSQIRQLLGHEHSNVGRLEIRYQPLVDLRSGEAVGAEALVRWSHPEHGLLSPEAFLGLVNSNRLDAELDAAVLHDVLAQLSRWRDEGLRVLPVSVNLTRDSLEDPGLADRILEALSALSLPTSLLHLEITEHHQLSPDSPAQRTLGVLGAAGVRVYLDDYGTGYTSLEYLNRFPIHMLKLDRSVVMSLQARQTQLIAAVHAMARTLNLDIIAEGIETPEQRNLLVDLGIRYGQGYLFSHPLTAEQYRNSALAELGGPAARAPFPRSGEGACGARDPILDGS